jgi:hypothetical protein
MTGDIRESAAGYAVACAIRSAETAFGLKLDAPTVLREGRATVVRAFSSDGRTRGTVIIKQFKKIHREHFIRERAGLGLLSSVPGLKGFVPQLLADDEAELVLLIEDVTEQASYSDVIAPDGAAAAQTLVDTARRLGIVHGRGRNLVSGFRAKVPERQSPGTLLRQATGLTLAFIRRALSNDPAAAAALAVGSDVHSQLTMVADRVDEPGILSTITVGDMAPSNLLLGSQGPVFIDLEYCEIRNAFYDAMYWHCIYPVSADIANRMDLAYRDGLRVGGVDITEDSFVATMFLFMSHRLFWTLSWNMEELLERDRDVVPGVSTRKTICEYLREYVRYAETSSRLEYPALVAIARRLEVRFSQLWPEAAVRGLAQP